MQDLVQILRDAIPKGKVAATARESGISYSWLVKFARGDVTHRNPGWNHLHKLGTYLGFKTNITRRAR